MLSDADSSCHFSKKSQNTGRADVAAPHTPEMHSTSPSKTISILSVVIIYPCPHPCYGTKQCHFGYRLLDCK